MTTKRGLGPVLIAGKRMPWGKGVIANGFVFLSGLDGSVDDQGRPVQGIEAQTIVALDRGERYLREAGSSIGSAVRVIQYLARAEDLAGFHATRDAWFAEHAEDLMTEQSYAGVLVVQRFTNPDRLVELEVTAVLE